jgi:hypothetical protein
MPSLLAVRPRSYQRNRQYGEGPEGACIATLLQCSRARSAPTGVAAAKANPTAAAKKIENPAKGRVSHSGYRATSSVSFGTLIFFITFRIVTLASIFLLAFAFVITDETLFLTAVLFVIAILVPIVAAIFASIVSDNHVCIVDRI